jgi:hypothetical protein
MSRSYRFAFALATVVSLAGCVSMPQQTAQPPATTNFNFNPPDQATKKLDKTVAVVGPKTSGTLWTLEGFDRHMLKADERERSKAAVSDMLKAARTDLEKVLIARGFGTVGPFASIDEMTYSQKERAFVLFEPVFETTVRFNEASRNPNFMLGGVDIKGTVTTQGSVTLAFFEPLSKEKVWLKRVDLPAVSEPYTVNQAISEGRLLRYSSTQGDALVRALNKFYKGAMDVAWNQVDPREVAALQKDVDQLKAKKRY